MLQSFLRSSLVDAVGIAAVPFAVMPGLWGTLPEQRDGLAEDSRDTVQEMFDS